jgi:hypothetical protein
VEGQPQPLDEQDEAGAAPKDMLHVASLKRELRPVAEKAATSLKTGADARPAVKKPVAPAKAPIAKVKPAPAERKLASSDPLAPLASPAKPKKLASAEPKDSGSKQ